MKRGVKRKVAADATLPPLKAKDPAKRVLEFITTHLTHSAGALAGTPLKLAPWQRDEIITPIFGRLRPDGLRQIRTAFATMPRRNGKSSVAAAIGLYLAFADHEPGAYVVSAAANRDQARVVFGLASKMVTASPVLSAMATVYRDEIVIPSTGSRYKVLSRDSKPQHGQDLSGVIVDELHSHRDAELYRVLTSSTGSRRQPLTFVITTASSDPHSIATEVYEYAQKVAAGVIPDPSFYSVMYSAPEDADPWAEATWRACNPALRSGFRHLDELRTAALQAQAVPAREASFRQLYLNQWGSAAAARWIPLPAWDACAKPVTPLSPVSGRRAFLGLDLSSTADLTALAILVPDEAGGFDLRTEFWCPAESLAQRSARDHVPYELWRAQGHLTATPGNVVDYSFVAARLHALMAEYDVAEIAIDPWNARGFVSQCQLDALPMVEVAQTMASLSTPSKEFEKLVLSGALRHDNHPVMRWCLSNVVADVDGNGNIKPSKKRSIDRIDGVSATVTALARALVSTAGSVYDRTPMLLVDL